MELTGGFIDGFAMAAISIPGRVRSDVVDLPSNQP